MACDCNRLRAGLSQDSMKNEIMSGFDVQILSLTQHLLSTYYMHSNVKATGER